LINYVDEQEEEIEGENEEEMKKNLGGK